MATVPYTYHLFHRPTGRHYYGVRFARGCHPSELWVTYFSSSEYVLALNPFDFDVEVRRTFRTANEALVWEQRFLEKIDAPNNPLWLNQFVGKGLKPHSPETLAKMRKAARNRPPVSEETRRRMRESHLGLKYPTRIQPKRKPLSEETKRKISEAKTGRKFPPHSLERRQRISEGQRRRWARRIT